ncbi:MAG: hypothetical protein ACLFSG_06055 [Halothiobacillaceae bacterium]
MSELVDIIPPQAPSPPGAGADAVLSSGAVVWPWLLAGLILLTIIALLWRGRRRLRFAFWLSRLRAALRHDLPADQAAALFAVMLAHRLGSGDRLGALRLSEDSPWAALIAELEPIRFGRGPADTERLRDLVERAQSLNWRSEP